MNVNSAPFELLDWAISDLASNGSEYYMVWNFQRPDFTLAVMGSRVSPAGALLDGSGVDISSTVSPFGNVIGISWDGIDWRASWANSSNLTLRVAKISSTGLVQNPGGSEFINALVSELKLSRK